MRKKKKVEVLKQACLRVWSQTKRIAGSDTGNRRVKRGAGGDISTRLDILAEKTAIEVARKNGIKASIVAEESGFTQGDEHDRGFLIIDAIDGTTNAGRSIPFCCCSMAYATSNLLSSVTDASVIDLTTGELYWSSVGEGAYVGSTRLHSSRHFGSVVGINISGVSRETVTSLAPTIASIKHVRQFGAVALELCLLARGKLDAYIDFRDKVRPTDLAAGYLIAGEAGVKFYTKNGSMLDSELSVHNRLSFFATTQSAHKRLGSLLIQK